MNAASNTELEDFEKSTVPERFELNAPSTNMLLPSTNASVSRREDRSVEIKWSREDAEAAPSTISADSILAGIEESVRRRIDRFPRSARAHANLGVALLKQGHAAEAYKELDTALELDPDNYIAGITLARLHFDEGRIKEAESCYEKLLRRYPDDAAVEIGQSNILIKTGRYDDAHLLLSKAAALHNRNPYIHFLLGVLCLQKSDLRCALNEFRTASHLDFRSPNLYHAMGVAYALQGEHLRAEKAFKTALKLAPDSATTVNSLARTLLAFGKGDQAIEILNGYLELHSGDLAARDHLAAAYMQAKRYSLARTQIAKILEVGGQRFPKDEIARHHINMAVSFMHQRSFEKAKVELKLAIQASPNGSAVPYDNLARAYALTKKIPLAIEVLKQAVEMFPSSRETRVLLSVLYANQEDYPGAISQVEAIRQYGPLTDDNYASLGHYYGEAGFTQKSIEVLMEGYAKYPKSSFIINNLAYFLLMNGQTAQARAVLNSKPPNVDDRVELIATAGLLHLKEGDYDAARRLYKRAENMASKSSRKDLARKVRQKMHLELGRYHVEQGEYATAQRQIQAGLQEKQGQKSVVTELEGLAQLLKDRV